NSNDSPQAVLSVDADATAVSEADSVAEYGTVEEFPSRSFFGEALVGYYRSSFIGPSIPRFDYVPIAFRVGYRPWEDRGYIASRMSVMLEATADPITKSFGNYLTGASLMLRYDACPSWTICPYFQVGTGFVLTDAWRDQKQMAIGEEFEFLQQVEFGVRWKLRECLSVEAEYGLQHTSNAGFARRNGGANDLGVSIGLRWTFGGR
ncbi:MAG TPA: acyloxyacyl hydrolase, partial [Gemmataceae bacterium]|nr:acyloxyacyl hydrolase [Gemmataceae bacterium]